MVPVKSILAIFTIVVLKDCFFMFQFLLMQNRLSLLKNTHELTTLLLCIPYLERLASDIKHCKQFENFFFLLIMPANCEFLCNKLSFHLFNVMPGVDSALAFVWLSLHSVYFVYLSSIVPLSH